MLRKQNELFVPATLPVRLCFKTFHSGSRAEPRLLMQRTSQFMGEINNCSYDCIKEDLGVAAERDRQGQREVELFVERVEIKK